MKFIILVKATQDSEKGVMPPEKLLAEMGTYHEELGRTSRASSSRSRLRLPGVSEVARAAALMASDYASAMTAVIANVTCGYVVD